MTSTQGQPDLISVITNDHREVEQVFSELEQGLGDPKDRKDLVDHVIAELVRHSVAEEQYMYPAARKSLSNGNEIADHEIEEHGEAEQLMKKLAGLEATDPKFEELLGQLMDSIRHHVEDEENDLLPKLQQACSADELRELGGKVVQAKEKAPTRPHPKSPSKPPANRILDPGAGFIDQMRDRLTGRNV